GPQNVHCRLMTCVGMRQEILYGGQRFYLPCYRFGFRRGTSGRFLSKPPLANGFGNDPLLRIDVKDQLSWCPHRRLRPEIEVLVLERRNHLTSDAVHHLKVVELCQEFRFVHVSSVNPSIP